LIWVLVFENGLPNYTLVIKLYKTRKFLTLFLLDYLL
jgi:hypothetical protein